MVQRSPTPLNLSFSRGEVFVDKRTIQRGRTGAARDEVLATALDGRLGPAIWDERGLCCRPTDAEVHYTFPDYARSEIAKVNRLDPDALVAMTTVRQANRGQESVLTKLYAGERWKDASGRVYVLKSEVRRAGLVTEVPAAGPDLDAIGAALQERGRSDVNPAEMLLVKDVVAHLRKRFPFVSVGSVYPAITSGRMLGVRVYAATRSGGRRKQHFVHVPPRVLRTRKREVIEEWLGRRRPEVNGEGPPVPAD